jgi:hypothetical protein
VLDRKKGVICPHCGHTAMVNLGKGKNKKVELSLLVHPQWLAGEAKQDAKRPALTAVRRRTMWRRPRDGMRARREDSPAGGAWRAAG